jgi:uncharacterized protein involved in response to NO
MHFSTQPTKQTNWFERFVEQPHQLFFTTAIIFAFYTMFTTLLNFLGYSFEFHVVHSFGLIFALFTNAFLGFLITVIPKYSASVKIEKNTYLIIWVLYQSGILLVFFDFIFLGKMIIASILLYTSIIFYKVINQGYSVERKESYLLTFFLILGALILLLEIIFQEDLSILLFYGYLLNIVFLIALKMVPNFYTMYTQRFKWEKPRYTLELSLLLLFSIGIASQFEFILFSKIVSFIALVFFGYIIFNLDIYTKTPAILTILVISFIWFYIGIVVYFIETILEIYTMKLSLHILALGFVLNLFIGFGSRVTMGHAVPPQQIVADKFTQVLFLLMQVVIISRILGSVFYMAKFNFFIELFYISISLWIILFLGWSIRYGKTILRIDS